MAIFCERNTLLSQIGIISLKGDRETMAVGAKDRIDVMLVKKYAMQKVDNPIIQTSMVDPEKMYEAMNDYAQMHLCMLNIQHKLKDTCISAISGSIQYTKSRNIRSKKQIQAALQ